LKELIVVIAANHDHCEQQSGACLQNRSCFREIEEVLRTISVAEKAALQEAILEWVLNWRRWEMGEEIEAMARKDDFKLPAPVIIYKMLCGRGLK
jgi:hypothetical protein